jgi:hypothetical protein
LCDFPQLFLANTRHSSQLSSLNTTYAYYLPQSNISLYILSLIADDNTFEVPERVQKGNNGNNEAILLLDISSLAPTTTLTVLTTILTEVSWKEHRYDYELRTK